ncbi:hypothetical protein Brsp05_04358 [Brucella sp. NBRC 12953]|uniref:hypothetical protein n=1 Tax=Brucella sp. NBRC 12953 TaxID=3075481 RepID=UPI0013B00ABD
MKAEYKAAPIYPTRTSARKSTRATPRGAERPNVALAATRSDALAQARSSR